MQNDKINPFHDEILQVIKKNKYMTIPEISKAVGKSEATIYRHLKEMMRKGLVTRRESRKKGYWDILG